MSANLHKKAPIKVHYMAAVLPLLDGEKEAKFRQTLFTEDGKLNIEQPVVIIRDGADIGFGRKQKGDELLDGRNRTISAINGGAEWEVIPKRDYDFTKDGTPEDYVRKHNVDGRRHLTDAIRAIYAARDAKEMARVYKERDEELAKLAPKVGDSAEGKPAAGAAGAVEGDAGAGGETTVTETNTTTTKKGAKKDSDKHSHQARNEAAAKHGVSVHAIKQATAFDKYDDLTAAVAAGKMQPHEAASEAANRRAAEAAKRHETKIATERKEILVRLKGTFGESNAFVKRVISKKIFGDEKVGHRQLKAFDALEPAAQRALIPGLFAGKDLKALQELVITKKGDITTDAWTLQDLADIAIVNGLGWSKDKESKEYVVEIGDFTFTVTVNDAEAKNLATLISKV